MMTLPTLFDQAERHLNSLCLDIGARPVGSGANRRATDYVRRALSGCGFRVQRQKFECLDWTHGDVQLHAGGQAFEARISPYSLGTHIRAPLVAAATVAELEEVQAREAILLVHGVLASEPLMPKRFPFYNPEEHQRIVRLLEEKRPAAIVAATGKNPGLSGGMYPFPWIEDGDVDIPSAFIKDVDGERMLRLVGAEATLEMEAERMPATGCNVIATRGGGSGKRLVVCAHVDTKEDTPGALDNAAGIVVLLLLGELLRTWDGRTGLEIVALNGEDTYHAVGQVLYLQRKADRLKHIELAINLDGAGYREGRTAYSLYECSEELSKPIRQAFAGHTGIFEGEQWYQSDHMIFVQNGRPAMAITSEQFPFLSAHITHTPKDAPELVDTGRLVEAALALRDVVLALDAAAI